MKMQLIGIFILFLSLFTVISSCNNDKKITIPIEFGKQIGIWNFEGNLLSITDKNLLLIYINEEWIEKINELIFENDYYFSEADKVDIENYYNENEIFNKKYKDLQSAKNDNVEVLHIGSDKNLYIGTYNDFFNKTYSVFKKI